jgi:hypothetical protein
MLSIPALLLTAGWVVLVLVILVLFGRTVGGAWSIAGGVARGVREWRGQPTEPPRRSPARTSEAPASARAEIEDL